MSADALEVTKLTLLTHSKNMLDAAQKKDWERFSCLERDWMRLLQSSVEEYGSALQQTGEELIKDNQKIQDCMEKEQKRLLNQLGKNARGISLIKSYLE